MSAISATSESRMRAKCKTIFFEGLLCPGEGVGWPKMVFNG